MASYEQIMDVLSEIKALIESRDGNITARQVTVVNGLSDVSERLGLVRAGEFRTGNSKNPGDGFTGVRIGYPSFRYSANDWHIVGVSNDVLQFGVNAVDGKLYAGGGAVILDSTGIVVKTDTGAFLLFEEADGTDVATIKQDGAGNLQIDLIDSTKALTINNGNLIVNHATSVDGKIELYENNTLKTNFWWDASDLNASLENHTSGGNIFIVMKGGGASERVVIYDRTAARKRFALHNAGYMDIYKTTANPAYEDGYVKLYFYSDGAGVDELRVRGKIGATETQVTLANITP